MNPIKLFGQGLMWVGLIGLGVMTVVGTVSIDIVLMAFLLKNMNKNSQGTSFLSGFIFGLLFSNRSSHSLFSTRGVFSLLAGSFFTSMIALAISFGCGVPQVGIAILIGWGAVLAISVAGMAFWAAGELLGEMCISIANYFSSNARADRPANHFVAHQDASSTYTKNSTTVILSAPAFHSDGTPSFFPNNSLPPYSETAANVTPNDLPPPYVGNGSVTQVGIYSNPAPSYAGIDNQNGSINTYNMS